MPPNDLEAEVLLISSVVAFALTRPEVLPDATAVVTPEMFYSPAHRRIWETVLHLHETKTPVELATVAIALRDEHPREAIDMVRAIENKEVSLQITAVAARVAETWRRRETIAICQRTAAEGYEPCNSLGLIDNTRRELTAVAHTSAPPTSGALVEDVLMAVWKELLRDGDPVQRGLSWGFGPCDKAFGRLIGGLMSVVCARAGCGKTSFAWHVAENVAMQEEDQHGLQEAVFFVSGEMSTKTLVSRQVAIRARVAAERIENATLTDDDYAALTQAQKEMGYLPIIVDDFDGRAPTPVEIQKAVRAAAAKLAAGTFRAKLSGRVYPRCRLRLVIVDYLQRLKSPLVDRAGVTRERHVAAISTGLSDLAKALDVHVLALSQAGLHGESSTKDLTMKDIRESGQIEADADSIIFMTRPESSVVALRHAKARHRSLALDPVFLRASKGAFWEDHTIEYEDKR